MEADSIKVGDRVEWNYGQGLSAGHASGRVVAVGVEKWGYDDVIEVDVGDHIADIRPDDVI